MPLAKTVRQCVVCRRVLSWPVLTLADPFRYSYNHCGKPTEFLVMESYREEVCHVATTK